MISLDGKTALITGASRGIGRAIAEKFFNAGCALHLAARDGTALSALSKTMISAGDRVATQVVDLSSNEGIAELTHSCSSPDILINNAGAIPAGDIEKIDDAAWLEAWNLKVFGYIRLIRNILPRMYARGSGVILNIIGTAGVAHRYNYICGSTGNAALIALTHALGAGSPERGVRVVGINPSATKTERIERLKRTEAEKTYGDAERWRETLGNLPFGRLLEPNEIADLALFLVSDQASYLSGTVVDCDGGGLFR